MRHTFDATVVLTGMETDAGPRSRAWKGVSQ